MIIPNEIMNKIYSYYWSNIYYENVILELKKNIEIALHTNKFIKTHILYNVCNIGKYYLQKYNNILKNISENKGLRMFLFKNTDHIFKYMENVEMFNKHKYPYLCCYCCVISGRMRYVVINDFAKII